jgi:hypothetical protein
MPTIFCGSGTFSSGVGDFSDAMSRAVVRERRGRGPALAPHLRSSRCTWQPVTDTMTANWT